eukprot:1150935-Pelagomonas_calceolata.AAC.2
MKKKLGKTRGAGGGRPAVTAPEGGERRGEEVRLIGIGSEAYKTSSGPAYRKGSSGKAFVGKGATQGQATT